MEAKQFTTILDTLDRYQDSERIALICGEEQLAYRELIADARHIARGLMAEGVKKGERVLWVMHRRADAIRALFGILYAGASYVAADPEWPGERLDFVQRDAGTVFAMTDESCRQLREKEPSSEELPKVTGEEEAAIYYTSGSTGQPKGTVLHHIVFGSMVLSHVEEFSSGERLQSIMKLAFVGSMFDCSAVLARGKTLLLSTNSEQESIDLLASAIAKHHADAIHGTPSVILRFWENPSFARVLEGIRYVIVGGERILAGTAKKIVGATQGKTIVTYGSSEMFCCAKYCCRNDGKVHLGKAGYGVRFYLLDGVMEEIPTGGEGELFIGGIPAKYGHYLNRPDLDTEKYVEHPRLGRLFRTGDLVRLEEDGEITLLGRKDGMVKLHGQRIEIGEVENAMASFLGIRRTAVRLLGESPREMLAGYYTAEGEVSEAELRRHLADRLPYYMVPSLFMKLKAMPENANGKLDYRALPEIELPKEEYVPPKTEKEKLLCGLFAEMLKLNEPVSVNDSFFALGGDSISGLKLASRLAEAGISMEMKWLFAAPSPALLASLLTEEAEESEELPPLPPWTEAQKRAIEETCGEGKVERLYPVSAGMEKRIRAKDSWMLPGYWQIACDDATAGKIENRFAEMTEKHASMRSVFLCPEGERPVQAVLKEHKPCFSCEDISGREWGKNTVVTGKGGLAPGQKHYLGVLAKADMERETDLSRGPLLRLVFIRTGRTRAILYLCYSHLLFDGQSVFALMEELLGKCGIFSDREKMDCHFRRLLFAPGDKGEAYWHGTGISEGLTQVPKPDSAMESTQKSFMVGMGGLAGNVEAYCRQHSFTLAAVLHYCLGRALAQSLHLETCSFLSVTGGRGREEMNLCGGFVHTFPFVFHQNDTVADCQQQLLSAEKHAWLWSLPERMPFPLGSSGVVVLDVVNLYEEAHHGSEGVLSYAEALDGTGMGAVFSVMHRAERKKGMLFLESVPALQRLYFGAYDPSETDPAWVKELSRRLSSEFADLVREREEDPMMVRLSPAEIHALQERSQIFGISWRHILWVVYASALMDAMGEDADPVSSVLAPTPSHRCPPKEEILLQVSHGGEDFFLPLKRDDPFEKIPSLEEMACLPEARNCREQGKLPICRMPDSLREADGSMVLGGPKAKNIGKRVLGLFEERLRRYCRRTELISVVVPVYNGEKHIAECLGSLVAQTWPNLEILVVNDGSTDGTERIVKDFAERDGRIRLIHLPRNRQPYQARLAGFGEAVGDYVIALDADDRFSEDYLEMLVRAAIDTDADLAICDNIQLLREKGPSKCALPAIKGKAYLSHCTGVFEESLRLYADSLRVDGVIYQIVWNKLCRRDLMERALPHWREETWDITYGDDIMLTTVLLFFTKKAVFTKYGACYQRKDNASTTRRDFLANGGKVMMDLLEMSYFLERFFDQVKPGRGSREMLRKMKQKMWGSMELQYTIQRNGRQSKKT